MWKVSLVGHSQIPKSLNVPNVELNIFRAPGGKASSFFEDNRMNEVLKWEHDLCILWLGSNDIKSNTNPDELLDRIAEICHAIERDCQAVVIVCQIEPRLYLREIPVSHNQYKKIQGGINNRLKRRLSNKLIHFNTCLFVKELASDGVHWSNTGRDRVDSKLKKVIKGFILDSDSD